MNKVFTTKDFKEGKVGIKFGGNFDLLSSIVSNCGLNIGSHIDSIKKGMCKGDMFIWIDGGYLTSYNAPPKSIVYCVSESEIYLLKDDAENKYSVTNSSIEFGKPIHSSIESISPHYDNSNGSLYLFAQQHNLNAWEFDIIKRIVRCRKKGDFEKDLQKTKVVIDLYLKEFTQ